MSRLVSSSSDPDFEIKTSKDILKFCEFFYDDYVVMGVEMFAKNHPNYPNIRECEMLYNHVSWKSTHPARDMVLIAEIEKYLGDSKSIKFWIKNDAKIWVRGETEDGNPESTRLIPPTNKNEIIIPIGTSSPSCETFNACYLPSLLTIDIGDTVKWKNTDTSAHTVTSGSPSDGPSGTFDSSLLLAGSSFEWTPTTKGEFPYYCMIHPWMIGIILVGGGMYVPSLTDTDGDGISDSIDQCPTQPETVNGYQDSDGCRDIIPPTKDNFDLQVIIGNSVYDLSDTATMNLSIGGINTPQNVALEISDPSGTSIISRSFMVDSQGVPFEFKIDENFKTGAYKVVATTNNNGNTVTDTAYFKVKSQYNSFKITSVGVTDQQGNPSSLQKGEIGFIKVNLEASKSITTLVTVNLFDSDLTSIGIGSIKTTLSSGNSEIILSFMIPSDVAVGSSNVYVNAFSDWPSNGGIPLTSEISVEENIK